MPSFLTQCPHCLTPFRVTETQLEAADGLVRCGACLGIFSAAANRITLKQTPEEAAAAGLAESEDETEAEEDFEEDPVAHDAPAEVPATEPEESFAATPLPEEAAEPQEFVPQAASAVVANRAEAPDADLLDQEFDIQLGDLNLDNDEEPADAEEYEEEEEDFDDDDAFDDEDEPDEDYDDEEEEEFDDEEIEEDEEFLEEADEALATADDDADELPPPVAPRAPVERVTTDKVALRKYLAEIEDDDALEPLDDEALDFEEPVTFVAAPRRSRLLGFALFVGNVLLAGVLLLQYTNANLEALSRSPRFAPLLPYACRVLSCPAAERSQLARLVTEQLVVRSHPRYAQALEVNLVFRNDATEAQPFPALELGFSDTSNRLLANRLFKPVEYLPNELQTSEMPPRSSYQVLLEMADPGSEAVNYTLVFREP